VLAILFTIVALAAAAAEPATLTADLDGDGQAETATARLSRRTIHVEIDDAGGRRLASADAASPGAAAGPAALSLSIGPLGSSGALLEVAAAAAGGECHSVFRFRGGTLSRLPLREGSRERSDCGPAEGWTVRWERPSQEAPSVLVRERTLESPTGAHREREVFAFTGFALELDPARSSAEIGGVSIPAWSERVLYTRMALEILKSRYDLSKFRSAPRLVIEANRARGVFAFHFSDKTGELVAPVTAFGPGAEAGTFKLSVRDGDKTAGVRAVVRDRVVTEVIVSGLSPRWDAVYLPANKFTGGELEIFARAEDEVASDMLVGLWTSERGEQMAVNLVPGVLGVIQVRQAELEVLLDPVPSGSDVLLVPRNGSAPTWALALRGGNGLARLPVRCSGDRGAWKCESAGPAVVFHRVGGRMNAR
jgi:hypothetical protein